MRVATALVALGLGAAAAPASAAVQLVPYGTFSRPIFVTAPPGDPNRVFVVERSGTIQVIDQGMRHQFLDISATVDSDPSTERGLLSMAFAPDYATSGLFYVFDNEAGTGDVKIEEFRRSAADPDVADPSTRRVVLQRPHGATNHNGGQLQFGPDGFLYATIGDNATSSNAQTLANVYGKILRLDPVAGHALAPADNPFVTQGGDASLIWALGLRNPWRFSFDRATGDLVIADVGNTMWEEIDWAPRAQGGGKGLNFGWPTCEGFCTSAQPGLTDPVFAYDHSAGRCAITGGYVVHADDLPSLAGRYLYGDYCGGELHSLALAQPQATDDRDESLNVSSLYSFGEDACSRLYAMSGGGTVYRVSESAQPPTTCTLPPPNPNPNPNSQPRPAPQTQQAPRDTTAPRLFVSFRKRQRVLRSRRIVIGIRCSEPCNAGVSGAIHGAGRRASRVAGQERPAGTSTAKLVLRVAARSVPRIARALRHHARVFARVHADAHDLSGNPAPLRTIVVRIVG